jgi:hypothetical protein
MTTKVLKRRQACWARELAGIDFKIFDCARSQHGKLDALSLRLAYRPLKGGGEEQPIQTVLQETPFENTKLLNTIKEEVIITAT